MKLKKLLWMLSLITVVSSCQTPEYKCNDELWHIEGMICRDGFCKEPEQEFVGVNLRDGYVCRQDYISELIDLIDRTRDKICKRRSCK